MKKEDIVKALEGLRKSSKKRNFKQSVDLVINLKNFDFKKDSVDNLVNLPFLLGKEGRVCGIVDDALLKQAKESCDEVIYKADIRKYSDKKLIKKVAKSNDFFIAQANLMGEIASVFGRVLGPLGKMPNPKMGGVILPSGNVKDVVGKFKRLTRVRTNKEPSIKVRVGNEEMKDEELAGNIIAVYDNVVNSLGNGARGIKAIKIKFTMSEPAVIGEKNE